MTLLLPNTLSARARTLRFLAVFAVGIAGFIVLMCLDPIPQSEAYHGFADQESLLGIPHFADVATNLAFLIVGLMGLILVSRKGKARIELPSERLAYGLFFTGLFLTAFGSAWFHLDPTTERLFWDRLPMTLAFMPFLCIVISERVSPRLGAVLLLPLTLLGAASVVYWHLGERSGHGDLRFYGFVQFFPMAAVPLLLLLFPSRYSLGRCFWYVLAGYGLAKIAEYLDKPVLDLTGAVTGHNLKHLLAAAGAFLVIPMLKKRRLLPTVSQAEGARGHVRDRPADADRSRGRG